MGCQWRDFRRLGLTFTGEPARVFRRFPLAPWPAEFRRLRYPPALAPIRDRAPASRQARLTARKGSSASSASSSCLRRYRTIYVWIADQGLMITVQTNSHPPEGTDKLGDAINAFYEVVKK
jgi:hypothetical protein